jgi:hypothetical protein
MPELIILFFLIIISLLTLFLLNRRDTNQMGNGGDQDDSVEPFSGYLQSCPKGFTSFYDNKGDMICCDGAILANRCTGNRQCILNGPGTDKIPSCTKFLQEEYNEKAESMCPESMNYYEDKATNTRGCTSGELNDTMTGPRDPNQPICKVYDDLNKNITSADSCYNAKKVNAFPCFGKKCIKRLIQPSATAPALVAIEFTDDMGIVRIAYPKESLTIYLDAVNPGWREKGMDLSKNINVAEVAKAVFIDKTTSPSSVQV